MIREVFSRCSYVSFDDIDDAQQLFKNWRNETEVERLVNLGANGIGYKDSVRLPLVSSKNVVTVDDDDLTVPSRLIRLCAFDDGV